MEARCGCSPLRSDLSGWLATSLPLLAVLLLLTPSLAEASYAWSVWSPKSPDSCPTDLDCGVQPTQTRTRVCEIAQSGPDIIGGAPDCRTSNATTEVLNCAPPRPCTGNWTEWSPWTNCSSICNMPQRRRFRSCESANESAIPECFGDGPYVETESCTGPTVMPPSKRTLSIHQIPDRIHEGGSGALICCALPAGGGALTFGPTSTAGGVMNRSGLFVIEGAGYVELLFTYAQMSDRSRYACQDLDPNVIGINHYFGVLDRPTTPPPTQPPTSPPTTNATAPASTTIAATTAVPPTTTPGVNVGAPQDDDGLTTGTILAIVIPIAVVLVIVVTIVAAYLWRHYGGSNQVLVGSVPIDPERGVRVNVVKTQKASVKRTSAHYTPSEV